MGMKTATDSSCVTAFTLTSIERQLMLTEPRISQEKCGLAHIRKALSNKCTTKTACLANLSINHTDHFLLNSALQARCTRTRVLLSIVSNNRELEVFALESVDHTNDPDRQESQTDQRRQETTDKADSREYRSNDIEHNTQNCQCSKNQNRLHGMEAH